MRKAMFALSLFLLVGATAQKPVTTAELTDPAGDVKGEKTSDGTRTPFDVIHLAITSDGSNIHVAAKLKDPPGDFAADIVRLYIDADNNAATGARTILGDRPGFEYVANIDACVQYTNGGKACVGQLTGPGTTIKARYGLAAVEKFGDNGGSRTSVRSPFNAPSQPIEGNVVRATIAYADLGLKPGQVIRILARETDAVSDDKAFFPEIALKLK